MVDNRPLAFQTLNALGYPVVYQYPAKFDSFPCISYFDSGHVPADYADGKATVDITEITVDVWQKADNQGNLAEIHPAVATAMKNAGFYQDAFISQFEEDTRIHHITFKFIKSEMEA